MSGTTTGSKRRRRHLESLDRAEHRDRGRDDAVAVEQRGAEEAERDQQRALAAAVRRGASSASSARMPPSPRLSARMMKVQVLDRRSPASATRRSATARRARSRASASMPCWPCEALRDRVERATCRCRRRRRRAPPSMSSISSRPCGRAFGSWWWMSPGGGGGGADGPGAPVSAPAGPAPAGAEESAVGGAATGFGATGS